MTATFLDIITVLNISLSTVQPQWTVQYQDRWAQPGMALACVYPCDSTVWRYGYIAKMFATSEAALRFINHDLRDERAFERNPTLHLSVALPMWHTIVGYDDVVKTVHVIEKTPRKDWMLPQ